MHLSSFLPHPRRRRPPQAVRGAAPRRPARHRRRLGAAVVEFALVANVMILIVFVCIEFTRMNMLRNLVQDAAYFAARTAMVPGGTADDARAEAQRVLDILSTQNAEIVVNEGEPLTPKTRNICVRVTIPIDDNALFVPLFSGDKELEAVATMKTERYDGFYNPNE